jgi:hypothetical protein
MCIIQIKVLTEAAGVDSRYLTALEWNEFLSNDLN